jgi:hypothetical protein
MMQELTNAKHVTQVALLALMEKIVSLAIHVNLELLKTDFVSVKTDSLNLSMKTVTKNASLAPDNVTLA